MDLWVIEVGAGEHPVEEAEQLDSANISDDGDIEQPVIRIGIGADVHAAAEPRRVATTIITASCACAVPSTVIVVGAFERRQFEHGGDGVAGLSLRTAQPVGSIVHIRAEAGGGDRRHQRSPTRIASIGSGSPSATAASGSSGTPGSARTKSLPVPTGTTPRIVSVRRRLARRMVRLPPSTTRRSAPAATASRAFAAEAAASAGDR